MAGAAFDYRASGGNCKRRYCSCCTNAVSGSVLLILGTSLICTAILLPSTLDGIIRNKVADEFVVTSVRSKGYPTFVDGALDTANKALVNVTMFNLTNPGDVLSGAKPCLTEVGPLVYWLQLSNFDVSWRDGGDIIDYVQWRHVVFQPELSRGTDAVNVTSVNLLFQSVVGILSGLPSLRADILELLYPTSSSSELDLFAETRTARDILFGFNGTFPNPLTGGEISFPFPGVFGNATEDATREAGLHGSMYTGLAPSQQGGHCSKYIVTLNNSTMLQTKALALPPTLSSIINLAGPEPMWSTSQANVIAGSATDQFCMPLDSADATIPVYSEFLFRTIEVERVPGFTESWKGLKLWRYHLHPRSWLNSSEYPPNAAYYMNGPSGLWNLSRVEYGLEVYLSKPHFMNASASVLEKIDISPSCMRAPREDLDETMFGTEPVTGLTLYTHQRFQANIRIQTLNWSNPLGSPAVYFPNLNGEIYLPVYKFDVTTDISEKTTSLYKLIYDIQSAQGYAPTALFVVGGISALVGAVLLADVALLGLRLGKVRTILRDADRIRGTDCEDREF